MNPYDVQIVCAVTCVKCGKRHQFDLPILLNPYQYTAEIRHEHVCKALNEAGFVFCASGWEHKESCRPKAVTEKGIIYRSTPCFTRLTEYEIKAIKCAHFWLKNVSKWTPADTHIKELLDIIDNEATFRMQLDKDATNYRSSAD